MPNPENAKWCIQFAPAWQTMLPKFYFTKRYLLYAWVRKEVWLYIGLSKNLKSRIGTHHVIGKKEPTTEDDTLYIWLVDEELAHKTEQLMIKQHKPRHNIRYLSKAQRRMSQMQ